MIKSIVYIFTILEAIEKILIYSKNFRDSESFYKSNEQLYFNACLNLLTAIGEESKKIDETLKTKHKNINWQSVASFRNEVVHNYRGIDKQIVWDVICTKIVPLKQACINMLKDTKPKKEDIEKYISLEYYKHLRYLKDEI